MNIQEIANEHTREIIKSIFSKLNDEEKYVILELNKQLQDKINKISKVIDFIDNWKKYKKDKGSLEVSMLDLLYIKEILGDKEKWIKK